MRWLTDVLLLLWLTVLPGHAMALSFENCGPGEVAAVQQAVKGAGKIAGRAAAAVGDTAEFRRWFGAYSGENAEYVRRSLKAVDAALDLDELKVICPGETADCKDTYAFVYTNIAYSVHLCPLFFGMPSVHVVDPRSPVFEHGTREGTIIHEVSHFNRVARTDDHCYRRSVCAEMARTDPGRAIDNADSYQYYSEDVFLLRPVGRP